VQRELVADDALAGTRRVHELGGERDALYGVDGPADELAAPTTNVHHVRAVASIPIDRVSIDLFKRGPLAIASIRSLR
jgi:hypothetical protein